jgi:hypothetical protein
MARGFLTGKEFHLESSSSDIQTPANSGSISRPSHILISDDGFMLKGVVETSEKAHRGGREVLKVSRVIQVQRRNWHGWDG